MIMDMEIIAYSDLEGFGLRGMGMCLKSRTEEKPMQASSAAVRTRAIICCGCSLAHLKGKLSKSTDAIRVSDRSCHVAQKRPQESVILL